MIAKISKNSKKNIKRKNTTKEKSGKDSKKKITKKPTVPKNVCGHSIKLTDEELNQISKYLKPMAVVLTCFMNGFQAYDI